MCNELDATRRAARLASRVLEGLPLLLRRFATFARHVLRLGLRVLSVASNNAPRLEKCAELDANTATRRVFSLARLASRTCLAGLRLKATDAT